MRLPRLYTDQPLTTGKSGTLSGGSAHYLRNVLRIEPGREVILFNGTGGEYRCTISLAGKKAVEFTVDDFIDADRESPLHTELAIGLSRGDRMDFVLQKATELGVTVISPLFTERSEVKLKGGRLDKKMAHWQQVIVSACEQCQRTRLPVLHPPQPLSDFLARTDDAAKLILHPGETGFSLAGENKPERVNLLVGPEGGFSDDEVSLASGRGFRPWSLGPRILRTETAPLTALAVLQSRWGDFSG